VSDTAVVIVSRNTRDLLRRCLESVLRDAAHEVVVVDNASSDGSAEMVRAEFPQATLIANQTNSGYGTAANQGFSRCHADYVLLLNADTEIAPGTLEPIARYLDAHPTVGLLGPRLTNPDGTPQRSCYHWPTPGFVLLQESGLERYVSAIPMVREAYLRTWSQSGERDVAWVLGAAIAIRKSAFDSVSGFDESFFMYYEEADICRRLQSAGWDVRFAPVASVTHVSGSSSKQQRTEMLVEVFAGLEGFYKRHFSRSQLMRVRAVLAAVMIARIVRDSIRVWLSADSCAAERLRGDRVAWIRILLHRRTTHRPTPSGAASDPQIPPLQRADWRFLLPTPPSGTFQHLLLLGGPPGLGDRLLDAGFARAISTSITGQARYDAVALLSGGVSRKELQNSLDHLEPGGAFYCEVDRRRWHGLAAPPGSMQRLLSANHVSTTGLYWAAPNLEAAKKYVPLGHKAALRWYFSTLCVANTPLRWMVERGVAAFAACGSRCLPWLLPWYALTGVSAPISSAVPLALQDFNLLNEAERQEVHPLMLTSGQDDGSRVVILPFLDFGRAPECVIKVARLAEFNENIEREQEVLAEIQTRLEPTMRHTVPQALGIRRLGNLAASAESYAPGRSIFVSSGDWRASTRKKLDDLHLAVRWLSHFNRQVQLVPAESGAAQFALMVDRLFKRYLQSFDPPPNVRRLLAMTSSREQALANAPLPIVWTHNDFGPWNMYRHGHELLVIDRELGWGPGFDHAGPALSDLIFFVTHWSYPARGLHSEAGWTIGFRQLFVERDVDDEIIAAIHRTIDTYVADLEIDPRFVPLVLVYTWVERALNHRDREWRLGSADGANRSFDQFDTYVHLLADSDTILEAISDPQEALSMSDLAFDRKLKILS